MIRKKKHYENIVFPFGGGFICFGFYYNFEETNSLKKYNICSPFKSNESHFEVYSSRKVSSFSLSKEKSANF